MFSLLCVGYFILGVYICVQSNSWMMKNKKKVVFRSDGKIFPHFCLFKKGPGQIQREREWERWSLIASINEE